MRGSMADLPGNLEKIINFGDEIKKIKEKINLKGSEHFVSIKKSEFTYRTWEPVP